MEYNGLVSVVMPVHNGEKYLREAIESVLNQTYTNFEFLIIENCSTDSSVEIIKSYNDHRIRLIIENNCGQVQAYNRGFKEAKGEYVFIHDHDDISHPERFEKQLENMIKNNIEICGSYFSLIDENKKIIGKIEVPIKHDAIVKELLYRNSTIFNSSVCINKKVFMRLDNFNIKYFPSADYEFYLRGVGLFVYGNIPEFLYSWRQHPKQISSSYIKEVASKTIAISLMYKNKFPANKINTYTGLVYYYNDKLLKSFGYFFIALFLDKFTKKLLRYFLIVCFAGVPLKLIRKFNLVNSKLFLTSKKAFNKVL